MTHLRDRFGQTRAGYRGSLRTSCRRFEATARRSSF
jgi:hypothetical protein